MSKGQFVCQYKIVGFVLPQGIDALGYGSSRHIHATAYVAAQTVSRNIIIERLSLVDIRQKLSHFLQ